MPDCLRVSETLARPNQTDPRPTTHALDHVTAAAFAAASLGSSRTVYTPRKRTRGPTSGVSPIQREPPEPPGPFTATLKTSPANPTRKPSDRSARRWSQRSPLTRLITQLPQHSRPLPKGPPGLFTRLGHSRGDRHAEFHQSGRKRLSAPQSIPAGVGALPGTSRSRDWHHSTETNGVTASRTKRRGSSHHPRRVENANAPG